MISIVWFRRDLRLEDNIALLKALSGKYNVIPLFIFDTEILDELEANDARVSFIHQQLSKLHHEFQSKNSSLLIKVGSPVNVWKELLTEYDIKEVHFNRDYEPYALKRDQAVKDLLSKNNVLSLEYKDQVIFEPNEILKSDKSAYTVFTPYKKKWLERLADKPIHNLPPHGWKNLYSFSLPFPSLKTIGFKPSDISVKDFNLSVVQNYSQTRNIPAVEGTSRLSVHLRFGTVSIRKIVKQVYSISPEFLSELIWREFFMQILFHYPHVVNENFKSKYNGISWRNNKDELLRWQKGETGYPMVDAGMRQLNQTGYMHNRVRMITAGFLCKHLLIDWRLGEAYFAQKLLDYELSSNNGNWQWAAGTGCDAAPYFRIFNPTEQLKKFDPEQTYIKNWIPEYETTAYPAPIVEHKFARQRALETYKKGMIT